MQSFIEFLKHFWMAVRMVYSNKLYSEVNNLKGIEPRIGPEEYVSVFTDVTNAYVKISYSDGEFYYSYAVAFSTLVDTEGVNQIVNYLKGDIAEKKQRYLDKKKVHKSIGFPPDVNYIDNGISSKQVTSIIRKVFPNLDLEKRVSCPLCKVTGSFKAYGIDIDEVTSKFYRPLIDVVIHLNDTHRMSREKIADWVETLSDFDIYSDVKKEEVNVEVGRAPST